MTTGDLPAPVVPVFYAQSGGGAMTVGWYGYAETFVTADGETGAGPTLASQLTAGQNAIALKIGLGITGVTNRRMYRTAVQASSAAALTAQLKLVTTLDNTTDYSSTYWLDVAADASLGANVPTSSTAPMHRVAVSAVAIGASPTSARKVYRTAVGGSQLKLQQTIANNTATVGVQDATPDGSLGADAPTADTSGLTQPSGQVNAGSSSLLTASAGPFQANGGWAILSGGQVVRYTGVSGNTLTGIPTSGVGSITTTVLYGSQVLPSPALTGVNAWNGLTLPMAKGSAVHIWVQRDDLAAQAALAALEGLGGDGIREYTITDERRGEASLIAVCDADLALFSRPAVSVDYYTRDPKSRTGRIVHLDLTVGHFDPAHFDPTTFEVVTGWGLTGEFRITSVDITFDGPALRPRYHVKASSVPAFTFGDVVRKTVLS